MISADQKTRVLSLKDVPRYRLLKIVRRRHLPLWYVYVIGLIGQWGSGKSLSGSVITFLDFMVYGLPVWANMDIHVKMRITDVYALAFKEYAARRGYECDFDKGGVLEYQSLPLDKEKLLMFAPEYHDGLIFLDEINLEFSESRRAISNTNLFFDRVNQQLRKRKLSMAYTVLDEMWIDPRVRDFTGLFFKCRDKAITEWGMRRQMQPGLEIELKPYEAIPLWTGRSYKDTKKPLSIRTLHARKFWNIYDTWQTQAEGGLDYSIKFKKSEDIEAEQEEWGWLYRHISQLKHAGHEEIARYALFNQLDINPDREKEIDRYITKTMKLGFRWSNGEKYYVLTKKKIKELVLP